MKNIKNVIIQELLENEKNVDKYKKKVEQQRKILTKIREIRLKRENYVKMNPNDEHIEYRLGIIEKLKEEEKAQILYINEIIEAVQQIMKEYEVTQNEKY